MDRSSNLADLQARIERQALLSLVEALRPDVDEERIRARAGPLLHLVEPGCGVSLAKSDAAQRFMGVLELYLLSLGWLGSLGNASSDLLVLAHEMGFNKGEAGWRMLRALLDELEF